MLTEVLAYLRNWFESAKFYGTFTIQNGTLQTQYSTGAAFDAFTPKEGQYVRIIGSALNDGVYAYSAEMDLKDEEFDGAVWLLAVPPVIISIAQEIQAWQTKNGGADSAAMSPFMSESFGGYSYSKGASNSTGGGSVVTWQDAFKTRLAPWRLI